MGDGLMDVMTKTVAEWAVAIRQGDVSSFDVVARHLEQIAAHNVDGMGIRAVIEVNPEALLEAEARDRERQSGFLRGPLHGVPVLVKDNLDTADAMQTTAGSLALEGHRAREDAEVVRRLRAAGAVIVGKANLTEWANFLSDHMPNGYSSRGGQTLNPYGPGRFDVGGSSSGSGAGVAAGFAPAAIGTETSGSILSPASANSLVGLKPTLGMVSRRGIIPIAMSQDTAGPMARTVGDAALLMSVIAGPDPRDVATQGVRWPAREDWLALRRGALQGARIGVPQAYLEGIPDDERRVFDRALSELGELGADVIACDLPKREFDFDVLVAEFPAALNAYLATVEPWLPVHSLGDVMAWNAQHAYRALRYGQAVFERAQAQRHHHLADGAYIRARLRDLRESRQAGIDAVLAAHRLDALAFVNYYGCAIAAKAGYPSITVPAGYTEEAKPVGLTLTGTAYSDVRLCQLAYDYEQATNHRRPPAM